MVITKRPRPLRRDHDGILFYLHMEDWPEDVPLPEGTEPLEIGDGAYWPYWNIILESDRTVELIFGWFIVSLSMEETFKWYQTEMERCGWIEIERTDGLPSCATLRYRRPETGQDAETYVIISIRRNRYLNRTQPMIRRVTIHPWSPAEEETSEMEAEQGAIGDESMVAKHSLGEGVEGLLDKVAISGSN